MPIKSKISQTPRDKSKRRYNKNFIVAGIPEDTHAQFKGTCARMGVTMRDVFIQFMWAFVRANPITVRDDVERVTSVMSKKYQHRRAMTIRQYEKEQAEKNEK